MSLFIRLLLLFLLTTTAFALDRNAFSISKYDLEFRVNPEESAVAARGKITLRNDSNQPQTLAALQISSSLAWRMIEGDGKPLQYLAEPQTTDIDHTGKVNEAVITLPAAVAPKGTVELEIGYSGTITRDAARLNRIGVPEAQALASDWDRVENAFSAVRGIGHVAWYPIASDPANLSENTLFAMIDGWQRREAQAQMKVKFCWVTDEDRSYTVVANGRFDGIGSAGPELEGNRAGCTTYLFQKLGENIPTFAIAPFELMTRPTISLYYQLGHTAAATDYALAAETVQPWVEQWFGPAKEKVQVIELPDANAAPFESGAMLFTPLNKDRKVAELTMAHQLTHASFTSPRRWISEGLAQFAQAYVRERQDGRRAALEFMSVRMPPLVAAEKQNKDAAKPLGDAAQSLVSTTDEVYYRIKAMYVWWMLRDMVGDEALRAAIQNYHADQDKDPVFIQRLILAQSRRDLEWFFDDWVYRDRGLPDFRIASAFPRETLNNSHVVAVTVENTGTAGAEIPVTVDFASGQKSERMVVKAGQKEITRISVSGTPIQMIVSDGSIPETDTSNNRMELPAAPEVK